MTTQSRPGGKSRAAHWSDAETTTDARVRQPAVEFRYVDTHPTRQVVRAIAVHADGTRHTVGHLPGEGWFCACPRGKRCARIADVRELVPGIPGGT